jgi:hypothetical protein
MTDPLPALRVVDTDFSPPPLVIPLDPQLLIDAFLQGAQFSEGRLFLCNNTHHQFNGICHEALEKNVSRDYMYRFLNGVHIPSSKPDGRPRRLVVKKSLVDTMMECLAERIRISWKTDFPHWKRGVVVPFPAERAKVFKNGILDILSGEFISHTSDLVCLDYVDYDYDEAAEWPKWQRLNGMWFGDDSEMINTVQQIGGLCQVPDMSYEKIFVFVSDPRLGKGVIIGSIRETVGALKCTSTTIQAMSGRFALENWINKTVAELVEGRIGRNVDAQIVMTKLLGISGRDPMPAEAKHIKEETIQLRTRILASTNEILALSDSSGAFASRLIVVALHNWRRAEVGSEDIGLKAEVMYNRPAIFNYYRKGYLNLIAAGQFKQPSAGLDALLEIRYSNDLMLEFADTQLVFEKGASVLRRDLQNACEQWCQWRRKAYPGPSWVGRRLKGLGRGIEDDQDQSRGEYDRYYLNVRVRTRKEGGLPPRIEGAFRTMDRPMRAEEIDEETA